MLKRIKRLLRKRNNGGFTLIEVVVSSALLGVLLLGVLGFMSPVLASVREKQANARATMLAEAIDSYIASSVRNAKFLKVYTNVSPGNYSSILSDADYDKMKDKMSGEDEIRAIAFQWAPTGIYNDYKLVLRKIDLSGVTAPVDVMGDAVYDGLYLVPEIKPIDNQYQVADAAGNLIDQVSDDELHNVGIEITTNVYTDSKCYNTDTTQRHISQLAFVGKSYDSLTTISSQLTNPHTTTGYRYEIFENTDYGYTVDSSLVQTNEDGDNIYYAEIVIVYVVRPVPKTGTTTP